MGIIIKKRKLSPSGSMARIVEDEDGSRNGEIIDAMGHRCTLSGYGIQLLQVIINLFVTNFIKYVTHLC